MGTVSSITYTLAKTKLLSINCPCGKIIHYLHPDVNRDPVAVALAQSPVPNHIPIFCRSANAGIYQTDFALLYPENTIHRNNRLPFRLVFIILLFEFVFYFVFRYSYLGFSRSRDIV